MVSGLTAEHGVGFSPDIPGLDILQSGRQAGSGVAYSSCTTFSQPVLTVKMLAGFCVL
jgi:hypothetical protein